MNAMSVTTKHLNFDHVVHDIELTEDLICLAFYLGDVKVFDKNGIERWTLDGHEGAVWVLSSWGTNILVSGSSDHTARVWDLNTGYALSSILCTYSPWRCRTFPHGRQFELFSETAR